jgi:hypothetical protein
VLVAGEQERGGQDEQAGGRHRRAEAVTLASGPPRMVRAAMVVLVLTDHADSVRAIRSVLVCSTAGIPRPNSTS